MKAVFFFCVSRAALAHAFVFPQQSTFASSVKRLESFDPFNLAKNSEFSVIEDDEINEAKISSEYPEVDKAEEDQSSSSSQQPSTTTTGKHFEYAALSPGTATSLQIQVGDLALARKAWKKRRRSGSPLLVPCSVLNMDRASMLRGNLVYLLHKFGTSQKDGVVLSVAEMHRRFKSHLRGRLVKHANALGHESPQELVESLFEGKATQDAYGVRLIRSEEEDTVFLKSPLSKFRALQKAGQATLLQVTEEAGENETMKHTGYLRCKAEGDNKKKPYNFPPLGAALRVSQKEDVDTGNIQVGSIHSAIFFDFDAQGDGGSPLLTLSLNPARRPTSAAGNAAKTHPKYYPIRNPRHMLEDLQVGDGPYDARVVRLGRDHALVDFGVGRKFSQQSTDSIDTPEFVKVFGTLRFKDAIDTSSPSDYQNQYHDESSSPDVDVFASMEEMFNKVDEMDDLEDGEEAEDITHLFSLNEDGSLSYNDPDAEESIIVNTADDDEEDEDHDHPVIHDMSSHLKRLQKPRTMRLRVGETVPVHILSISKQSSLFGVTTDPSRVQGKRAKDIKKENDVEKKLEKLSQLLGGLEIVEQLKGREYDGTVKATSHTGDWLYVQPNTDTGSSEIPLPVGVATLSEEVAAEYGSSSFARGDLVRIQLDGIDESRGQLAMQVIKKLSP